MTGIVVLLVAVICLGVGFVMGRRNGIESEMRRQLREKDKDWPY
ncbi:hypothetical protein [Actinophytocola oryzae]|uniref:Uncharacterized protein n=1 Tax=Actinophytocola oryzae TaxID=502181 RepID=A0A4R7VCX8_9PSEU|nr:hypothetical protein [Actinophytocola oryzae]TDV46970.1 hypothetical protein CLV71_110153 [Actinophytocola oryzae]